MHANTIKLNIERHSVGTPYLNSSENKLASSRPVNYCQTRQPLRQLQFLCGTTSFFKETSRTQL